MPKNGFFYFMLDFKMKQERNGKRIQSLNEAAEKCSEVWKNLQPDQKAFYNNKAKNSRSAFPTSDSSSRSSTVGERYTSQGLPFSVIDKAKKEEMEEQKNKKISTEKIIDIAMFEKNLQDQIFIFIAFNYFCKTNEGVYIPAEVGLIKYSLKIGIIDEFHTLINPMTLPLGMKYIAKQYAEETHHLPQPPFAKGETSYSGILELINKFCYDYNKDQLKPVFTTDAHMPIATEILKYLAAEVYSGNAETVKVLSLRDLFYNTKLAVAKTGCANSGPFPSIHVAQAHIDRDPYEYFSGIGCELHETLDRSMHCSLSLVKRWAFMFSDHCCTDLGIDLVPGKHIPENSKIPVVNDVDDHYDAETFNEHTSYASTNKFTLADMSGYGDIFKRKFKTASEIALINSSNVSEVSASTFGNTETTFKLDDEPIETEKEMVNYWKRHVPRDANESRPSDNEFYSFLQSDTSINE